MRKGNVHANRMLSAPSAHSVKLASMVWRVQTHMDADSVFVMDTVECVKQLMVILGGTFQISSPQALRAGQLSMNKVHMPALDLVGQQALH